MKVVIQVPEFVISIELERSFVDDILPLLKRGGHEDEVWTLQQRQTFNSIAGRIEEALLALRHVEVKKKLPKGFAGIGG
jgi:hypothetical protein